MATERRTRRRRKIAGSASWLALVAATSLGGVQAERVRAQIKAPPQAVEGGRRYRLVVQSYDARVRASLIPGFIRPRGSTQRSVTGDDLVQGVQVDLVELSDAMSAASANGGTVVAWVEPGEPDLEYDGRRARPSPGSVYGAAPSLTQGENEVRLYLDQRLISG